jgi:alanine racemase
MSRTAVAILSTENLLHNLQVLKERAKPAKLMAMIKANAYGHGIRSVALRLEGRVDLLGVACIDEALILRKIGINTPIVLMQGIFEPNELLLAATQNLHVVFNNVTQLEWLKNALLPRPLITWIKINTGMGRLGFNLQDARLAYENLSENKNTQKPIKIMSHFACADDIDHNLNKLQIQNFKEFTKGMQTELSLCNSSGIFNFPECLFDYVRPGIALYGVSPIKGKLALDYNLKPVMTLQTSLISVQYLPKGSAIGYQAQYTCPENMPIGIAALGYGDGYPITAKNGTPIIVNNAQCSLLGRVSMDMMAIDLRACVNAKVGDPVILWGDSLPIEEVAKYTANITWDMLTGVQHRVKFLWTKPS